MRLRSEQIQSIIGAITPFLAEIDAELRLFGSRVHDDHKGGDIDLLLLVDDPNCIIKLIDIKHRILASIKKELGDQKIDLLIRSKNSEDEDSFLTMIFPQSILLKQFVK